MGPRAEDGVRMLLYFKVVVVQNQKLKAQVGKPQVKGISSKRQSSIQNEGLQCVLSFNVMDRRLLEVNEE